MRVPLEWLREYCDPELDSAGIARLLTMTGTKVEAIHAYGVRETVHFRVGLVRSVERHPNADRLAVCSVDLGGAGEQGPGKEAQIVCGAPNVASGQLVAVALPGAVLPDGTKLRAAKLRGVRSEGMILSAAELGLAAESAGILVLEQGALAGRAGNGAAPRPGMALQELFAIDGEVLELEITPNRPDCLAVYGVARELHAAGGAPLGDPPWLEDPGSSGPIAGLEIAVECPQLCPRFTARRFAGVRIAPSPLWLQARLLAAGQRPINNVVDITNYVMLLTGQPSHAFDFERIAGGRLTVRLAAPDEQVTTLDGAQRTLDAQTVLIADGEGPTSIAGLMGGERSEVGAQTREVLIEVACWDGPNIQRSAHVLGLRSEASARFEKGLHPASCMWAQALITRLMVELCGAEALPGTVDVCAPAALAKPRAIALRAQRVADVLGMAVPVARQREILEALGFAVRPDREQDLLVSPPSWRAADITREADLIEEIARIAGLEQLPARLPSNQGARGALSATQRLRRRLADLLVDRGLFEVCGWTFCSAAEIAQLRFGDQRGPEADARGCPVALSDPLSEEQALLRTMLLVSLRRAAAHNAARERSDLALFEIGRVFAHERNVRGHYPAAAAGIGERAMLGVLVSGRCAPASWRAIDAGRWDFFALKGLLEAIAAMLGVVLECVPAPPGRHPFLHAGRAADVILAGESGEDDGEVPTDEVQERPRGATLGWLGELHPLALPPKLSGAVAMELDLELLLGAGARVQRRLRPISEFPALHRDLAIVLPEAVPFARLRAAVLAVEGVSELVEDLRLIDLYSGAQVGEGMRSLALSLAFRSAERTLAESEVEELVGAIIRRVEQPDIGGRLRGGPGGAREAEQAGGALADERAGERP